MAVIRCSKCGEALAKCACRSKKEKKLVDKQLKGEFVIKKSKKTK